MNIDDMTIGQAREIASMFGSSAGSSAGHSLVIGEKYIIRTVTMIYTGRVVAVTDSDISLSDSAWIADTGRFATALENGILGEVEPYPDGCIVSRAALVDCSVWKHCLPMDQK